MPKRSTEPLSVTHPELAKEALFDPSGVVAGTHKKLRWRCAKGHEWEAVVKNRALSNSGCPVCSNKLVIPGVNDLATTHPELAKEALFDTTAFTSGTHKKLRWRCAEGHEWEAVVVSRTNGAGCPMCAGRRVIPGVNDLATTHPEVAKEALFDAANTSAFSSRRGRWRCAKGHEWEAVVANRTAQHQGCPYCANRRVLLGFNDLATTHPDVAAEALFDPSKVTFGSNKKLPWRCAEGHEWEAPVAGRASGGEGCPVCAGKAVVRGVNDLATTHPELSKEALFDATKVIAGTHKRLRWRCAEGHEWEAVVKSRALTGHGCPYCANKDVMPGFNDLATTHPHLVPEARFDPTKVTYGNSNKLPWRCAEDHEWLSTPLRRASRGDGCPVCGNRKVLPGFNDLATTHPELAQDALFDATTVTAGSHKKLPWRCAEGHEWAAQVKSRAALEQGCPSCAATGYDPAKPGYLYLMKHLEWEMLQVGISNEIQARMRTHTRRGWEVLDVRGPMPGDAARALEVAILRFLTDSGARLVRSSSASMPERRDPDDERSIGEAWWELDYPVEKLGPLVEAVRDREWA